MSHARTGTKVGHPQPHQRPGQVFDEDDVAFGGHTHDDMPVIGPFDNLAFIFSFLQRQRPGETPGDDSNHDDNNNNNNSIHDNIFGSPSDSLFALEEGSHPNRTTQRGCRRSQVRIQQQWNDAHQCQRHGDGHLHPIPSPQAGTPLEKVAPLARLHLCEGHDADVDSIWSRVVAAAAAGGGD